MIGPKKYRCEPDMEVEAIQFTGLNVGPLEDFVGPALTRQGEMLVTIQTVAGLIVVEKYDWIVRGINGLYFVSSPEAFKDNYTEAELSGFVREEDET